MEKLVLPISYRQIEKLLASRYLRGKLSPLLSAGGPVVCPILVVCGDSFLSTDSTRQGWIWWSVLTHLVTTNHYTRLVSVEEQHRLVMRCLAKQPASESSTASKQTVPHQSSYDRLNHGSVELEI